MFVDLDSYHGGLVDADALAFDEYECVGCA
jgi:hypothetical protein